MISLPLPGFHTNQSVIIFNEEVRALHIFEVPFQFFLPCLNHSSTILFLRHFYIITSCQRIGIIRHLHKRFVSKPFPKIKMFLITHPPSFLGFAIFFQFVRWIPSFSFLTVHRKIHNLFLILFSTLLGIFSQ
jgi:hypothetical protein